MLGLHHFFCPKRLKKSTKPRHRLSGIEVSGVFCFLCLVFEEGAGQQITYSWNRIILKPEMRICELMLRLCSESQEESLGTWASPITGECPHSQWQNNLLFSAENIYLHCVKLNLCQWDSEDPPKNILTAGHQDIFLQGGMDSDPLKHRKELSPTWQSVFWKDGRNSLEGRKEGSSLAKLFSQWASKSKQSLSCKTVIKTSTQYWKVSNGNDWK